MNSSENPVPPSYQIINILPYLIRFSIEIADHLVGYSGRVASAGHQTIHFREIPFRYRGFEIGKSSHSFQVVAEPLKVVP